MSASELVVRYLAQRSRLGVLVPLAALLAGAGWLLDPTARMAVMPFVASAAQALLLVLAFRVWDDLEDRDRDAREHPERVTVAAGAGRATPFIVLATSFGIAGLAPMAMLPDASVRLAVLASVAVTLLLWYRLRDPRPAGVVGAHVVLLKYPAIAVAVAQASLSARLMDWRAGLVLVSVYLALCLYESFGDSAVRASSTARRIAVGELVETVSCYLCGSPDFVPFLTAEDDLTGKPGRFNFVTCARCGLRYQNPRLTVERIKAYYDDEYIAHRKKSDWGMLTGFFNWAMSRHDRQKDTLVRRFVRLDERSHVLDVGCAVGTFLQLVRERYGAGVTGVDFKDLSANPALSGVDFRCGLFYDQEFGDKRFDLITMWHFLEHDYDPMRTLRTAAALLESDGRLVIEVPRLDSLTFRLFGDRWPGLQAPQHTVLYDRARLLAAVERAGLEVVAFLPYGAFPAFFYFFAGAAFFFLRGRGLNLSTAIYPYFIGQILCAPLLAFEKQLNFAMQTVICRRRS